MLAGVGTGHQKGCLGARRQGLTGSGLNWQHQGAHRAPGSDAPRWSASLAVLRRVRDASASGGPP